jgi:hypothetical protein
LLKVTEEEAIDGAKAGLKAGADMPHSVIDFVASVIAIAAVGVTGLTWTKADAMDAVNAVMLRDIMLQGIIVPGCNITITTTVSTGVRNTGMTADLAATADAAIGIAGKPKNNPC